MKDDKGTLSIDFLAGFTIFLLAFVWVLSMVPGLLIGLQAYTIDYDAVAYRTSVILVEDPGQITEQNLTDPWESLPVSRVARFGLAVSRETPNVLSEAKVNRFFCQTVFSYPKDYQEKAIFGDYHYGFNISLRDGSLPPKSIGDVLSKDTSYPTNYGYMRRLVKIKGSSYTIINASTINTYKLNNSYPNVKSHTFSILINSSRLYTDMTNPSYRIDPVTDPTMINITDLNSVMSNPSPNSINLTSITINGVKYSNSIPETRILIDGNNSTLPYNVTAKNISIAFSPKFFQGVYSGIFDPTSYKPIFVNLTFDLTENSTFLNNSWSSPYNYNYTTAKPPQLRDGILEVAVWSGPVTQSAVINLPVAGFTGTPTSGTRPLTVQFTDTSTNTPTSWAWTFGDGGTSTSQNPLYTYANAGTYTVVLNATNSAGSDTQTRTNYITVTSVLPPPTVTGIAPNSGPATGGTTVTITGTGFTGATAVSFGGTPATSFTVNSAISITATSPTGSGVVDLTVTTPDGTSATSAADRFSYIPSVTGIAPNNGPAAGGTTVTITGTGFTGATAVSFGGTPATSFTVNSAISITATSPANAAGVVDVRVTTPGGTSAIVAMDQFTYNAAPTVTGIAPNNGPAAGGTTVTITGTGFTGATAVSFGGTPATSFTVNSAISITATSPAKAGGGTIDVRVTSPSGTSAIVAADRFTYTGVAPTVTGITPNSGPAAGGTTVTITGTGFTSAATIAFGATAGTGVTFISDTSMTVTSPAHLAGIVDVRVTTTSGTSPIVAADQFTYIALPTVTGIAPNNGPAAGGTTVTITGTGFTGAMAVRFDGIPATSFIVNSATQITAISPAHAVANNIHITVTTVGGTSATSNADRFNFT